MPTHLKAYQSHAQDLSIESGAVMCLGRIVIPSELRKKTLDHIHLGHPGIVAMKSLARTYVWWPKLSEEVEKYVLHCPECQKSRNTPPDYPLQNWPITSSPWERVHVDFAGPVKEQYYLLMQCAASKWPEVLPIASLHAHTVISKMREVFARLGVPAELVSDNGPPFTSALFTTFLKNNNIRHRLTTPYHPKSNGLIERLVQTVKQRVLLRCERGAVNKRLQQFLMSYRNSIHCSTKETPARLMIGRNLSTLWDHIQLARVTAMESQNRQKKYYDRRCKARAFQVGDEVWYRPNNKIKWKSGIIVERTSETTYSVECHGRYIRGHIDQLRRRYRETERQVVSGFDWPAIETSDTTYEKNDKERNSDDATRNDLEQPAENLASTEKIVTETLGSNTDANLQQENGPHNDSNQAMTVLRQSERKRTRPERFGASWPW
ncbi:hypothetical protein GJ496_000923 [Pomphorhynchus laevis]|nr:hypothetical protein GJ496_000923 [Pomphorhynchus laevis]